MNREETGLEATPDGHHLPPDASLSSNRSSPATSSSKRPCPPLDFSKLPPEEPWVPPAAKAYNGSEMQLSSYIQSIRYMFPFCNSEPLQSSPFRENTASTEAS